MSQLPGLDATTAEEVAPPKDVTAPEALALAAGFPEPSREQWNDLVARVLHGSDAFDTLSRSVGGVDVAPLYVPDDAGELPRLVGVPGLAPFVRGRRAGNVESAGWDLRARHDHPDLAVTRQAIATDLDNGATSLWLVLGDAAIPVEGLPDVLAGVLLDIAPVVLQAGSATEEAAEAFFALAQATEAGAADVLGNLGADPYGDALRRGSDPDLSVAVTLARRCHRDFPSMRAIVVDGTVFADAGAGVPEELGCSMAAGVGYLRALTDAGLDVDSAFRSLDFRYSAGADQFLTIAALRAARRLWNRVGEVSGASPEVRGQRQHAVTSSVMMTRRDPWVNMLRTTVACFAAGVGGAEAITVLPFDVALGLPDAFGRRIARNTQTLLTEEGHLTRVLDPAGGSWYVESLTDQLAAAAWDWFTEIERAGGLAAANSSGLISERIASAWQARRERVAHLDEAIIGVNEFPNLTETLPVREPRPTVGSPGVSGGLPTVRASEDFEALRDRVDAVAGKRGSRPAVFLARLAPVAASTARSMFAANLFQTAGIQTPGNEADDGEDAAIVAAFAESGTPVVCLCGTDEAYARRGEALTRALIEAGAHQVWVAGPPETGGLDINRQDAARTGEPGRAQGYVFAGCDALAVLAAVLEALDVDDRDGVGRQEAGRQGVGGR